MSSVDWMGAWRTELACMSLLDTGGGAGGLLGELVTLPAEELLAEEDGKGSSLVA